MSQETNEPPIAAADARAVVRLLGDIAALPHDPVDMKRALMQGLSKLIAADKWAWALVKLDADGLRDSYVGGLVEGFTPEEYTALQAAISHPDEQKLSEPLYREMRTAGKHVTRLQEEMDVSGLYPDLEVYASFMEAGVGPVMMSSRPLGSQDASLIAIYRNIGAPPFTFREAQLAHIILTEVNWVHEIGWPHRQTPVIPRLTPRQCDVLQGQLSGKSRKEIAADLGLSVPTINEYVKAIYNHFGVNSHAELIRRFVDTRSRN